MCRSTCKFQKHRPIHFNKQHFSGDQPHCHESLILCNFNFVEDQFGGGLAVPNVVHVLKDEGLNTNGSA